MYTLPSNAVASSVYYSAYLDTTKDIVVSFDYACYGSAVSGAEGFCVFFGNTQNPIINGGGPGPGLVYSTVSGIDTSNIPKIDANSDGTPASIGLGGLDSGIIGIGFDLTGNFGSTNYFNSGYSDIVTNSITIRSNFGSGNNIVTRTSNLNDLKFKSNINLYQQLTATDQTPDFKRVRVRLTDFGQRIVVDIKNINDLNFTNYLDYNFSNYNNSIAVNPILSTFPISWPSTVRCGLGFANGESGNTRFKIKGFNINGVISLSASLGTYSYSPDNKTLIGSQNYSNPAFPYFFTGDQMNTQNTYDGVLNHTYTGVFSSTNPAISGTPLILATPGLADPGAPYQAGDRFVAIVQTS